MMCAYEMPELILIDKVDTSMVKIPLKKELAQISLFALFMLLFLTGCQSSITKGISLTKDFYDDPKNWAVLDSSIPLFASDYDVFFVYPTQVEKLPGLYFNWLSGSAGHDVHNYVTLQMQRQFGKRVRIFSPFVPQLDYEQYRQLMHANREIMTEFYFTNSPLNVAIRYTANALQYYMDNYHKKNRPFFLVGYEQGAVILYEALRQCPKITPNTGMLAVYLCGIPGITPERISKDFKKNHLVPAQGRLDLGVIAIINTRMPDIPLEETYFTPGGYVINPINWRTDATKGDRADHAGAVFYKRSERHLKNRVVESPHFCSSEIDLENALINIFFDYSEEISDKERKKLEEEIKVSVLPEQALFSNAWGIFAKNISTNAYERTQKYLFIKNVLKSSDVQED